ncbi:metal-sensing transcriptional repressor [Sporolactobacillus sp. KGMB 08714]|uniref:metal-sensing transcriptional repressor n=1 Tax=Sporolactobacillus sp. KGMB 08714 TaxID=3064704 RepID=UPI002FBD5FCA
MKNRLKRIGGQIQEILRMTNQEADCRHSVMSNDSCGSCTWTDCRKESRLNRRRQTFS